ncbi:unnamed protein product [Oreochromis niloticus]|nr:unnamed protein product [Mustela putorius furo]
MERNADFLNTPDRVRTPNRAAMIWIFLLFSLTPVCAKRTQSVYEAEEDDNITIRWDSQLQADVSLINMMCVFHSGVTKILYKMIRGVEDSDSQHEQFAGRVQIDRDALRGGRVRLHVSRVTAEDSGNYRCDLAADYNKVLRRWELEASEHFVFNVAQKASPTTPQSGLTAAEGTKSASAHTLIAAASLSLAGVLVVFFGSIFLRRRRRKRELIRELSSIKLLMAKEHEENLFE